MTTNYLEKPISSSSLRISGEIVLVTSFFYLCFLLYQMGKCLLQMSRLGSRNKEKGAFPSPLTFNLYP
ncbi:MAG: hypothetical protein ABEI32_02535, partial [Halothece sp.]